MSGQLPSLLARIRGGIVCPKCGSKHAPTKRAGDVLTCCDCGYAFSLNEAMFRDRGICSPADVDPDCPPENTKVFRCEVAPGVTGWEVPPSGKSGGLLAFAICWLAFIAIFTALTLIPGASNYSAASRLPGLFTFPFWAIGIGMLYAGLRTKYAKHFIAVDADSVMMSRVLFNRTTRKVLVRSGLESVMVKEFYRKNNHPVNGIEIVGADGRIRFGTMLSREEKDWLAADLRRTIWPEQASSGPDDSTLLDSKNSAEFVPRTPRAFTVDFPPVPLMASLAGPLIGLLVVGAFLGIGIFVLREAGFFRWLWLGMNSLFAVLILHGVRIAWQNSNRTVRVTGDASQIRVQNVRHNLVVSETTIPRTPAIEVRYFPSGQNNSSMLKVEILNGGQTVPVVYAYPRKAAHEPLGRLEEALS